MTKKELLAHIKAVRKAGYEVAETEIERKLRVRNVAKQRRYRLSHPEKRSRDSEIRNRPFE